MPQGVSPFGMISYPYLAACRWLAFACPLLLTSLTSAVEESVIWHRQPAAQWNEATPVGNGRLGAMIHGHVRQERIQLNEDSLWSGSPQNADNPTALEKLPEIRQLLFQHKYTEAQKLAEKHMVCQSRLPHRSLLA